MDEFIESIPFTQTREYVQGIVRNEMIYRDLATHHTSTSTTNTASAKASSAAKGMTE